MCSWCVSSRSDPGRTCTEIESPASFARPPRRLRPIARSPTRLTLLSCSWYVAHNDWGNAYEGVSVALRTTAVGGGSGSPAFWRGEGANALNRIVSGHRMKKTIMALCVATCFSVAGCTTTDPRGVIEKHLGLSPAGAKLLDEALSHPQGNPPDVALLLHGLSELKQDRNLTLGILLAKADPDLMVTNLTTSANPVALYRAVLGKNRTPAGTTLVRPEDISNIAVEARQNGRTIGRFDWSVPGLARGTCRFVAKGSTLEYLGFLRNNPVAIYDCETIFSRHGNLLASQQWVETEYFVVIEPATQRTKELSRADRQEELMEMFRSAGLKAHGLKLAFLWDESFPLVCVADRDCRDKVIRLLDKSDDWTVGLTGRAVGTLEGPSPYESIKEQIQEMRGSGA